MLKSVGVDTVVTTVHHVVLLGAERRVAVCGDLEGLVAAAGGDDGVGGCDGWDDVLDHALGERVGHASDVELGGSGGGFLEEPGDVLWVVVVELGEGLFLLPGDDVGPFDAVLGLTGDGGEGTEGYGCSWCVHVELAFDAGGHAWEDDS